jgi:hypothetical protein
MSLHADDVREHGLTAEEHKRLDEDGFFIVPDALDPPTAVALRAIADVFGDAERQQFRAAVSDAIRGCVRGR